MKIALGIEYNGSHFSGWQSQTGQRTIQQSIEKALSAVADHQVSVYCAGRTDAKVHALQQVVHFDTPAIRTEQAWVFGCNANLPADISVLWARQVADDFHARYSAISRTYFYILINRRIRSALTCGQIALEYRPLSLPSMQMAANFLLGRHDFSAYRAASCQAKSPLREIYSFQLQQHGNIIVLTVMANAFLYHMVRNMVGVLLDIGAGNYPPAWAKQVLETHDRRLGGVTAPPEGLYLSNIVYPDKYCLPVASGRSLVSLLSALACYIEQDAS